MEYELVAGLEVHCQLNTHTKAFCGCSTAFGAQANTNVCPVCLAMPGSLPVLNARALESIIKMGLATNCRIAPYSTMARKNYFYPDLPKGYQISQFEDPVCSEGFVEVDTGDAKQSSLKKIRLVRIHLEEDAGKSIHDIGAETYVDANRCGVPLIEIVSYPDIRSTREASLYLQKIRQIVRYLGISDGNMDEGSLRCDANVSIRPKGQEAYGTRTEIKNMNSFKSVEKAMEYEVLRQTEVLESGGRVVQETLLWDADKMETRPMRSKEQAHDYRYFPEPDLVPIEVTSKMLEQITSSLPEFPEARRDRFVAEYKLPRYDAEVLTASRDIADYFEATVKTSGDAKQSSNWVMGEVLRTLKEKAIDIADFSIDAGRLGELITLYNGGTVSSTVAKEVFALMMASKDAPSKIVNDRGLAQVSDNAAIETAVAEIIAANPSQREQYRSGKKNLFGYFVGETMKQMSGKANPKLITDILKQKLDAA